MSYTMKPSVGMLPIDDLVDVIATKIKLLQNENAPIVRTNAYTLGGLPAEAYMLKEYSEEVETSFGETWDNSSDEIQLLRDELYQLKAELIKRGHIEDTLVADGFIEPFNIKDIKYSQREIEITAVKNSNVSQKIRIFYKNNWVIVKQDILNANSYRLATVESENGNDIELNIATNELSPRCTTLADSLGGYYNNTFSFSRVDKGEEIGYPIGLYTNKEPIRISKCVKASRARLTLEIAVEGKYRTLHRVNGDPLNLIRVDNPRCMFMPGDKIVIGSEIAIVIKTPDKSKLIIDKNIYVEADTLIYKVAYEAKLKNYISTKDNETGLAIVDEDTVLYHNLELVGIIPTRNKKDEVSDRLIFECNDIDRDFNSAELQIKWDSSYTGTLTDSYIGRIYGLNLAFDKKI